VGPVFSAAEGLGLFLIFGIATPLTLIGLVVAGLTRRNGYAVTTRSTCTSLLPSALSKTRKITSEILVLWKADERDTDAKPLLMPKSVRLASVLQPG